MQQNQTNGILITFCGLDGCGKSSMIRMLHEWKIMMFPQMLLQELECPQ